MVHTACFTTDVRNAWGFSNEATRILHTKESQLAFSPSHVNHKTSGIFLTHPPQATSDTWGQAK